MSISLTCSKCSRNLRLADKLAGKAIKCPDCASVLRVPGTPPPAEPPKPAPVPAPQADEDDDNLKPAPGAARRKSAAPPEADNLRDAPAAERPDPDERGVPEDLRERIRGELTKGEKLVWIGQPDPKLVFTKNLWIAVGGPILVLVIALTVVGGPGVLMGRGAKKKISGGDVLLLAALGVAGIVAIATPFYQRWRASKSCYAVSSRRAFVFERTAVGAPKLTVYNPGDLTAMRRRDWWFLQDAGDLIFRTKTVITIHTGRGVGPGFGRGRGGVSGISRSTTYYGFLAVRRPREIEVIIRETLVDPLLDKINA
jgi:hypothetical protein